MAMQIFNAVVDSIRSTPRPLPVRKHPERDGDGGQKSKPKRDPKPDAADKPENDSGRGGEEHGGIDELV